MNLIEMFKDKLENLVVPEASANPEPGEVEETGHCTTTSLLKNKNPFLMN